MEMLRKGAKGEAVEALQRKLASQGINPGPIDGVFGPKTFEAVKRYQERKGLTVDGIAGPKTLTALGLMGGPATPPAAPAPAAPERPTSQF